MKYPGRWIGLALAAGLFALPWAVELPGLSPAGHRAFSIFLAAVVLWISEAIPLHATAAVIILLEVLLISDKGLALPAGFDAPAYRTFFAVLADPVLILFLGGFFLAQGSARFELDRNLARVMLRPFGTSAPLILLGLLLITALFSMFMSNTATTAMMMAVVLPVMTSLPPGDRMRTGLALCVPIAANVGGMGTPIGTPPNAIALGALARSGSSIAFVDWMLMTLPFVAVLLLAAWLMIVGLYRFRGQKIRLAIDAGFNRTPAAIVFYIVFAVTVLLWLTESVHGVSSSIVGFVPVVILLATRVFSAQDLQSIQWHVLWLVAGGIALGVGVEKTGLDAWLLSLIRWESLSPMLVLAVLSGVALAMGTVISHSATSNLLVPLAMTLAMSDQVALSPVMAAVFVAVGSSLAMALPISTPPNAIAISTGSVQTRDLVLTGSIIGLAGWALFLLIASPFWSALGVLK